MDRRVAGMHAPRAAVFPFVMDLPRITAATGYGGFELVDIDGDGDLDIASPGQANIFMSARIAWWENDPSAPEGFVTHEFPASPNCPLAMRSAGLAETAKGLEGSSLETIRHMVASGLGITILPCSSAGAGRYSERLVTIRRFSAAAPKRRIALAWRSTFPRHQAVQAIRHAVLASGLTCVEMLTH